MGFHEQLKQQKEFFEKQIESLSLEYGEIVNETNSKKLILEKINKEINDLRPILAKLQVEYIDINRKVNDKEIEENKKDLKILEEAKIFNALGKCSEIHVRIEKNKLQEREEKVLLREIKVGKVEITLNEFREEIEREKDTVDPLLLHIKEEKKRIQDEKMLIGQNKTIIKEEKKRIEEEKQVVQEEKKKFEEKKANDLKFIDIEQRKIQAQWKLLKSHAGLKES